ncbi:MAG: single-stranded DNA-binding protein [Candidatus Mycalebacterium zealandia]|nr:MAG: single-stranded DNA-binding protein [Candidatus Mycalebacterium zealandia]
MRGVNKATVIGNVGSDPEMKYTGSGQAVANFSVATNESWTSKDGEKRERTEWHRIVAWGRLAEICGQYLSKGKPVYIEGSIRTRTWEDKEGNTRYTTEIHAKEMQFLGDSRDSASANTGGEQSQPQNSTPLEIPENNMDDDIPF